MYHIALCDDDPVFLKQTARLLDEIMASHMIPYKLVTFLNTRPLWAALQQKPCKYDLLLIDIMIDNENGITFAKNLRNKGMDINIIFIGCSSDFLLDGYVVEPVGYILKPVKKTKLEEVLLGFCRKTYKRSVIINTPSSTVIFQLDQVLYVEINNKTLSVHTSDNKCIQVTMSLNKLLNRLPAEQFIQCHRCYIVSIASINFIKRYEITLKNRDIVPVSKSRFKAVQNALFSWGSSIIS